MARLVVRASPCFAHRSSVLSRGQRISDNGVWTCGELRLHGSPLVHYNEIDTRRHREPAAARSGLSASRSLALQ